MTISHVTDREYQARAWGLFIVVKVSLKFFLNKKRSITEFYSPKTRNIAQITDGPIIIEGNAAKKKLIQESARKNNKKKKLLKGGIYHLSFRVAILKNQV